MRITIEDLQFLFGDRPTTKTAEAVGQHMYNLMLTSTARRYVEERGGDPELVEPMIWLMERRSHDGQVLSLPSAYRLAVELPRLLRSRIDAGRCLLCEKYSLPSSVLGLYCFDHGIGLLAHFLSDDLSLQRLRRLVQDQKVMLGVAVRSGHQLARMFGAQ